MAVIILDRNNVLHSSWPFNIDFQNHQFISIDHYIYGRKASLMAEVGGNPDLVRLVSIIGENPALWPLRTDNFPNFRREFFYGKLLDYYSTAINIRVAGDQQFRDALLATAGSDLRSDVEPNSNHANVIRPIKLPPEDYYSTALMAKRESMLAAL